jgi:hypothetical protein
MSVTAKREAQMNDANTSETKSGKRGTASVNKNVNRCQQMSRKVNIVNRGQPKQKQKQKQS